MFSIEELTCAKAQKWEEKEGIWGTLINQHGGSLEYQGHETGRVGPQGLRF